MSKDVVRYRVYEAREGHDLVYCGEYPTYDEAVRIAETEPDGLPESLWGTAKSAGHVAGKQAPEAVEECEEPESWHGREGWHCVVRVRYLEL